MPLYEFTCNVCGITEERIFSVKETPKSIPCSCGGECRKIISMPSELGYKYYTIPQLTGEKKYTYSEFKSTLKKHGLMEANDSIKGAKESPFRGTKQPKPLKGQHPENDVKSIK